MPELLAFFLVTAPIPLASRRQRDHNVVALGRKDEAALRQLAAAPIVLQAYIDEMLRLGEAREAMTTIKALFDYLRADIDARACPDLPMRDPALIVTAFLRDGRLDWRFRWFNLRAMRRKLGRRAH